MLPPPPSSTLFPYTTLFRSDHVVARSLMHHQREARLLDGRPDGLPLAAVVAGRDRKSTRLNSSHLGISYAVFCLKKKNNMKKACTGIRAHSPTTKQWESPNR